MKPHEKCPECAGHIWYKIWHQGKRVGPLVKCLECNGTGKCQHKDVHKEYGYCKWCGANPKLEEAQDKLSIAVKALRHYVRQYNYPGIVAEKALEKIEGKKNDTTRN